jgi:hypothetical protein
LQAIIFMQELHDRAKEGPEFEGWLARKYECHGTARF